MQEINLLQNKLKDKTDHWEKQNRVVNVILFLVLIVELVAAGMFFMLQGNAQRRSQELASQNQSIQNDIDSQEDSLALAKGLQAQAKNITQLLDRHVAWTGVIEELAATTYNRSRYMNISADTTGKIHVEGIVDDYSSLGKLILALETSEHFQKVTLTSTAPSAEAQSGVVYALEVVAKQPLFLAKNQ